MGIADSSISLRWQNKRQTNNIKLQVYYWYILHQSEVFICNERFRHYNWYAYKVNTINKLHACNLSGRSLNSYSYSCVQSTKHLYTTVFPTSETNNKVWTDNHVSFTPGDARNMWISWVFSLSPCLVRRSYGKV